MKSERGDVVLVLFPNSDLRTAKRRPALVIQRDHLESGLPQTIVAMISTNFDPAGSSKPRFCGGGFTGGNWSRDPVGFSDHDR